MAEQFVFEIRIIGDKSEGHYTGYKTQILRTFDIQSISPAKIEEAISIMAKAAVIEIVDELIERDEQAEKEPEE